jgi:hypothetical protein
MTSLPSVADFSRSRARVVALQPGRRGSEYGTKCKSATAVAMGVLAALAAMMLAGCTPSIGDKCALSTDCSLRGDRICDTSQPNGYCTVFNCPPNLCPDKGACVMFQAAVPGCAYDDYQSPSRTSRAFCMAHCQGDSDCRQSDGYICAKPTAAPWNALILDDNQSEQVCIVAPDHSNAPPNASVADPGLCAPSGPSVPPIDGGLGILGAGADARAEGGGDASIDATGDGAADAGASDASSDGVADAGTADGSSDGASDAANIDAADALAGG